MLRFNRSLDNTLSFCALAVHCVHLSHALASRMSGLFSDDDANLSLYAPSHDGGGVSLPSSPAAAATPAPVAVSPTASRLAFLSASLAAAGLASEHFPAALATPASNNANANANANAPLTNMQRDQIVEGISHIWTERNKWQAQTQEVRITADKN